MSDAIETGALRRVRNLSKPRTPSIGKHRGIDRTKDELDLGARPDDGKVEARPGSDAATDELELGRFAGRTAAGADPGKPAKDDELDLGQYAGKVKEKARPETGMTKRRPQKGPEIDEVVGPMRQKVVSDEVKAKRRRAGAEMEIASTRDTSEDTEPERPLAKRRSRSSARSGDGWFGLWTLLGLSVLLIVLTFLTFLLMPRYQTVGDPLIADPAFAGGAADWQQEGLVFSNENSPSEVVLANSGNGVRSVLKRDVALPPGADLLVLRAQVRGDDVRPGPEYWDQGRIYVAQIDAEGNVLWGEDHNAFLLNGTTRIRNYSHAFSIPDDIRTVRVGVELKNATGRMTVHKLQLEVAERPLAFLIAAGGLLAAWGALIVYSAVRTLRGIESSRIRIWLGIVCVLSVVGLMLPGYVYEDSLLALAYRLGIEHVSIDGIAHAIMFAVLALLVRLGRPDTPLWLHAGAWLLIGVASEVLQLFTVDRETSLGDLGLDALGILIGLSLAHLFSSMPRSSTA